MMEEDEYKYLGVPIGLIHNVNNIGTLVGELIEDLNKIEESLLAPWQKLDAIRTFVQPCLTYALRAGNPLKKTLEAYKSNLVRVVRKICDLPTRATTHYIFASRRVGGLALQDPLEEIDIQTVVQAIRILSSSDPIISQIARAELLQTVKFAASSNPTPALVSNFLSSLPDERLEKPRYRCQSLWTRARKAARCLQVQFNVPDSDPPTIATLNSGPISAKDASRGLHNAMQTRQAEQLLSLNDQGKVARALATDKYANASSWQYTGLNLRFKDWRFIHKARLNVVALNAHKSRWSESDPSCRYCQTPETLPHVLCHCTRNMVKIRERHDKVVDRLVNAVRFADVITDRCVAESESRVRPDIVVTEGDKVFIIDVCCPFDNGAEALGEAEQRKVEKYQHLADFFNARGKHAEVFGFVVGSLGTWYPPNEKVLNRLGMSKSYKNLFRKLVCADVIQGSTNIYRDHLGLDT